MSDITKAREAEKMLRTKFETTKAKEWAEISRTAHAAVEEAVWVAYQAGTPVVQIAKEYGTTNRGTIYEFINHRREYADLVPDVNSYAEPCITIQYLDNGHVRVTAENFRDWTKTDQVASGGMVDILSTAPGLWAPVPNADVEMTPLRRELANAPLDAPLWRAMVDAGFTA